MSLRGQPQAGRGNLGMRKSFVCKRLLRSARNDKRRLPFSWHKKNVLLWTLFRQLEEREAGLTVRVFGKFLLEETLERFVFFLGKGRAFPQIGITFH